MAGTNDADFKPVIDGVDDNTLTDEAKHRGPTTRVVELPPPSSSAERESLGSDHFVDRFHRREVLGRGGMGEVTLWRDDRLGREVAVKRLLPHAVDDDTARARFLREARVQGQLEHPAVVPVYDVREDGDGGLSLTMKRVRGKTLTKLLEEHSRSDLGREPSRRLLSAFSTVCLAIEFAHARGIVHRDLKPGNIMLGDFGEVYVLDWGLAKILGEPAEGDESSAGALSPSAMTQSGSVLGTLGYMAPEQLDDSVGPTTAASDVYSLGAILFEVLAGVPLLTASSPMELMQLTLAGVDARAQQRAPAQRVPPELEDVCVQATARVPNARVFTARALHDAVERYLEGDRDLSRRRALAAHHIDIATAALGAAATDGADDSADDGSVESHARATAMRELGTAIALDPSNAVAGRAVLRLLAEPPRHIPAAVRDEIDAMDRAQVKEGARLSAPLALTWLLFMPFPFFMHVLDWRPIAVMMAVIVVVSVNSVVNVTLERVPLLNQAFDYILLAVLCLSAGFVAGPLVTVPTLIATFVAALQSHPSRAVRRVVVAGGCGLFLMMVGLEWAGVTPTSYVFVDGSIHIVPVALGFPEVATRLLMMLSAVGSILSVALFISKMRDSLAAAQQRVLVLGWHLRQIVPDAVD